MYASVPPRQTLHSSLLPPCPLVSISINGHDETTGYRTLPAFSTLQRISGEATVTAGAGVGSEVRFDEVVVTFEGQVKTWTLGNMAGNSGRLHAYHNFLRLKQPSDPGSPGPPYVLSSGGGGDGSDQKLTVPFTFVIPPRLLPTVCRHTVDSPAVHDAHTLLPPSGGDETLPGGGPPSCLVDDAFPDMARVSYCVRVQVLRRRDSGARPQVLADSVRKVRVIPTSQEEDQRVGDSLSPPSYQNVPGSTPPPPAPLRKEKDIRKGMFLRGKLGRVVVQVEQPPNPIRLKTQGPSQGTVIPVTMTFTPPAGKDYPPPKLNTLKAKLKIATFFSHSPMSSIPKITCPHRPDPTIHRYAESITLSSRCMQAAKWTREPNPPTPTPTPEEGQQSRLYKTAITVPIDPPPKKFLVPTFASCLAARSYSIKIDVEFEAAPQQRRYYCYSPSVSINVPLLVEASQAPQTTAAGPPGYSRAAPTASAEEDAGLRPPSR